MQRLKRFLPDKEDSESVRRILAEETILVISVVKWILLAAGIGVLVGLSTTLFLKALSSSETYAQGFPYYFLILPLALSASALLTKYLAPDAQGHGTEKVIEALHKREGNIRASVVPVKLLATVITIASGGSAGKEGPCAQIGAGLSSTASNLLRFNTHDRKKLVICGISAGFASVFGTPIAGAIFGVEVLFAGSILYEVLLPSFIAGVTAFQVSSAFGVSYFYHPFDFVPVFTQAFFIKVVLAGMFIGLCSVFLIETLKYGERFSAKFGWSTPVKALVGGLMIVGLAVAVSTDYLGLGVDVISGTLNGYSVFWYDFIMKAVFTAITLSFGGSGGIVTPIFFIGSTAGALFGQWFGLDTSTFAAIGLVAMLAGSTNTPIASSILGVELFGAQIAPYTTVACVISFLLTGHRSVYPSQVLAIRKSESISVSVGSDMETARPVSSFHEDPVTRLLLKAAVKLKLYKDRRQKDSKSNPDDPEQP